MAYTFSHPAAILPLRKHLPFTALVVGSMAPDYLYFVPGIYHRHYGHTTQGIFTFCLPASFLVLWLFHRVLKKPLLRLLPYSYQQRLAPLAERPFHLGGWRRILLLALTFFIAIETHIWWDAFTHLYGFFPKHFPVLRTPVTADGQFLLCDLLQNATSAIGAAVVLVFYYRWHRVAQIAEVPSYYRLSTGTRSAILLLMTGIAVISAILLPTPVTRHGYYFVLVGNALDLTRAFILQSVVLAFLWIPTRGENTAPGFPAAEFPSEDESRRAVET